MESEVLASLREAAEARLTDTCLVKGKGSKVPDGRGGSTYAESTTATYPCLVQQDTSPREEAAAGKPRAVGQWKVVLPYNAIIKATDRLEINGIKYEVNGPSDNRSEALTQVVYVTRV